tara:strand:- start:13391 stop:14032 length:642 start_codon:yes stop_codon:yes gene_type:complete
MALITVSDLATYMDISFTNTQEDAVTMVIEGLQSELEAYLRRPIEQSAYTETYRVPEVGRGVVNQQYYYNYPTNPETTLTSPGIIYAPVYTLYLDNSPVVSVASVSITPATASATATAQVAEQDYVVRKYGIDLFNAYANDRVTVTYTAGLDGTNIKVFKSLLLRAATREVQNMHDDTVGLKDLTTRNVAPLETGFSERELQSIKRYRRVRVS